MPRHPRAVFAGLATLDVIHRIDRLPGANEKIVADRHVTAAGGPAANAAVAFAHLGGAASLITALPPHPLTDLIVADLAQCGVDTRIVDEGSATSPPAASILVTAATGERAVVSPTTAASADRATPVDFDPRSVIADADAVLMDGYHRHLGVPIAREARRSGLPVVLDAGSFKPYTPALLAHTDVAVVSADFCPPDVSPEPETVLDYLHGHGVRLAAVTRGADPVLYRGERIAGEVEVAPVDVVDTLGAGDVFHGALLHAIAARGLAPERFAADLAYAGEVTARSLRSFGTRAWLSGAP